MAATNLTVAFFVMKRIQFKVYLMLVSNLSSTATSSPSLSAASRVNYVDSAKGLCVMLVVILHTLSIEDLFNNLLFVLRMPLFFFCSGLFCVAAMKLNWSRFLTTKVFPILWLYVVWSILVYFSTFAIWAFIQGQQVDLIRPLIIFWQPAQTLWFLYALAITYVLTKVVIRAPVIVGVLFSVLAYSLSMYQADLMSASFLYKVARFFPFFYLAFLLKDTLPKYVSSLKHYWSFWLIAFFVMTYLAFEFSYIEMGPLGLVLGLLGIFAVLCLFSEFEQSKWVQMLAWVGKRSIFIFVIHRIPLFYANKWLQTTEHYGDIRIELLIVVGTLVTSLLAGEVLSRIADKYLFMAPWINSEKKVNNA